MDTLFGTHQCYKELVFLQFNFASVNEISKFYYVGLFCAFIYSWISCSFLFGRFCIIVFSIFYFHVCFSEISYEFLKYRSFLWCCYYYYFVLLLFQYVIEIAKQNLIKIIMENIFGLYLRYICFFFMWNDFLRRFAWHNNLKVFSRKYVAVDLI